MNNNQGTPLSCDRLPKIIGADIELGNFLQGKDLSNSSYLASRLLLTHIHGVRGSSLGDYLPYNPQDIGRKWLTNGSCCYIDLDHLEICLPEVRSAWDFTAAFHAQLKIVGSALQRAQTTLQRGVTVHALASNSDGSGSSWGSHLNFLVARDCFHNIFHKRLQYLLWLASFQASSIIINGQGKVGSENPARDSIYQISQRADFLMEVVGLQTTFSRPIINSRDEPLSGANSQFARFHHISCDVNLCHVSNVLKVGMLQIILAMVESESPQVRPDAILQDPVRAYSSFSHDPDLAVRERMLSGEDLSALDIQRRFFDAATAFVESGACEETVPRAGDILALWQATLDKLAARDWESLSRSLDWVLKRRFLEEVILDNPDLGWRSPEIKRLDLLYGSVNEGEGVYWALETSGCVERLVTDTHIAKFVEEPPCDTRAYTRANLLNAFSESDVIDVDWDRIRVRRRTDRGRYALSQAVTLDDPSAFGEAATGELFQLRQEGKLTDEELLLALMPTSDEEQATVSDPNTSWRKNDLRDWTQKPVRTIGNMPRR